MLKKFQIKYTITCSVIAMITAGCASNGQLYAIEDRLNSQGVHLIREIYEESYVLQRQIESQREQMSSMSSLMKRLEQKLYGVRFRITPTVIQLLHDYDELENSHIANRDRDSCRDVVVPGRVERAC